MKKKTGKKKNIAINEAIKEVIEEIGYTLTSVNVEEYKKKFSLFGR